MRTYVSLLRGINVSGQKKIRMAELRKLYESLGFSRVESYLQSGNVVFAGRQEDRSSIINVIAQEIQRAYGFSVSIILRDASDIQRIFTSNPFLATREEDPARLYVTFLAEDPPVAALDSLGSPEGVRDEFRVVDREVFLFCPGGYGRTRFSNDFFEKHLKVVATTRNWRTVTALHDMTRPG